MVIWAAVGIILLIIRKSWLIYVVIGWCALFVIGIIKSFLSLDLEGVKLEQKYIKIVTGILERTYTFVSYDKIEILKLKSSTLIKKHNIVYGNISILAATIKSLYELPYMENERANDLKNKIIKQIDN